MVSRLSSGRSFVFQTTRHALLNPTPRQSPAAPQQEPSARWQAWSSRFAKQLNGAVKAARKLPDENDPQFRRIVDAMSNRVVEQLENAGFQEDSLYWAELGLAIDAALSAIPGNPLAVTKKEVKKLVRRTAEELSRAQDGNEPLFQLFCNLGAAVQQARKFLPSGPRDALSRLEMGF